VDDLLSTGGRAYLFARTALDTIAALILLLVTWPLILLGVVFVRLTSPGPAFYSQVRLGRHGRPFTLYKIRSMAHDCESLTGPCWSVPGDARVTPIGHWLRRTHIDELPQLWNVLRGDMSLIGPRPERPEFAPRLEQAVPYYRKRLQIRPGVTGLAQVQLPPDTDLASVRIKTAYDLHYIRTLGPWLDFRVACATALLLMGVPLERLQAIFRFPKAAIIDAAYRELPTHLATRRPEPDGGAAAVDRVPVAG
jgi:lipopolysaccharide/colanic/teichoic acid biosynthesis glycosyltransferase